MSILTPASRKSSAKRVAELERRVAELERSLKRAVSSVSRGNTNLQYGWFITEEDIEKLRERNLAHDFTKSK